MFFCNFAQILTHSIKLEIIFRKNESNQNIVNDEIMLENIIEREEVQPNVNSSTEKTNFTCDFCNQELLTTKDLEKHKKKYHPVKHPCDICWLIFDTERGMRNHLRSVHQT